MASSTSLNMQPSVNPVVSLANLHTTVTRMKHLCGTNFAVERISVHTGVDCLWNKCGTNFLWNDCVFVEHAFHNSVNRLWNLFGPHRCGMMFVERVPIHTYVDWLYRCGADIPHQCETIVEHVGPHCCGVKPVELLPFTAVWNELFHTFVDRLVNIFLQKKKMSFGADVHVRPQCGTLVCPYHFNTDLYKCSNLMDLHDHFDTDLYL